MTARTHSANQNVWHAGATFSSLLFTIISVSISTGLCGEMAAARVKDIRPGAESSMRRSSDAHMQHVDLDGTLFFEAEDGTHGSELWKSDGAAEGTVMVRDIRSGSGDSEPRWLARMGGTLFFSASSRHKGRELWKSDSTALGTVMVKDINTSGSSYPAKLTSVGGLMFLAANDGSHGLELWKSDGTPEGTVMVKDIRAGSGSANLRDLTAVGDALYFVADDGNHGPELWRSDGTETGTVMVKDFFERGNYGPDDLIEMNGLLFCTTNDGKIWKSDGTEVGTTVVTEVRGASRLTNVNGTLYFTANYSSRRGGSNELWQSNGTGEGTMLVWPPRNSRTAFEAKHLANVNGTLFFTSKGELWMSAPPREGVAGVRGAMIPGSYSEAIPGLVVVEGTDVDGTALDVTAESETAEDETAEDEAAEDEADEDETDEVEAVVIRIAVNGAYFLTTEGDISGFLVRVREDLDPGPSHASVSNLTNVNGRLFFTSTDDDHGNELWTSDGTRSGTVLVADIQAGSSDSSPSHLTGVNGALLFSADDGVTGRELWKVGLPSPVTPPALTVEAGATSVAEGTAGSTLTVTRLHSNTLNPLTINLSVSEAGQTTIPAVVEIPAEEASVTISFTAADDHVDEDAQAVTVTATAQSFEQASTNVRILDNDTAGITISPMSGLTTSEAGGTASFSVALESEPTSEVTIRPGSSNPAEGTVTTQSVLFNSQNWNIPQAVHVVGVDDPQRDGDQPYTISVQVGSPDGKYDDLMTPSVSVINEDDDRFAFDLLPLDTTVSGITGRRPVDYAYFQFEVTAGTTYVIETSAPSSWPRLRDTVLYLYRNWDGQRGPSYRLAYNDDGGPRLYSRITFSPRVSGFYYLKVRGYGRRTGYFNIRVTEERYEFSDLPLGTTVRGHTGSTRMNYAYYRVQLVAGNRYRIETSAPASRYRRLRDTVLSVYRGWSDAGGPRGYLAYNDDGGRGLYSLIEFSPATSGNFYLMVRGYHRQTGNFRIRVSRQVSQYSFEDLALNTTVRGHAGRTRPEYAFFRVRMETGYCYTIETSRPSSSNQILRDTVLYIYQRWSDNSGPSRWIACNDDGGAGFYSRIRIRPRSPGDHYLMVRGYGGRTGQFNIRIFQERYEYTDLPSDTVVESYAGPRSLDYAYFRVQMQSGLNYRIETSAASSGRRLRDTVLSIYRGWSDISGPNRGLAYNDDGGVGLYSKLNFRPSSSGTYYLRVKGYRYQTGNFRIQVTAPRPDLVVSSVIANPAIVQAGGSTIISTSIRNNGDGPARDSEVSVTLNGESISAIRIGGLAAGRTAFFNFPLRNIQASPRVHSIAVTADSGNVIGESSEENNSRSATVTIAGKPDLVVEGLSARSDSTSQGIRWRIRFRVKNVGESEAGASLAGLYRSNRYVSGFEIGSLQPGESEAVEMEMIDSSAHVGWASRPSSDAPAQTQTDEGTSQASSEVSNSNTGDDGVVQIQHALLSAVSSPELRSVTFSATADESDQVNESNESNNIDEPIVVSAPRG